MKRILTILVIVLIAVGADALTLELRRCHRIQVNGPDEKPMFYWTAIHWTAHHGICALMDSSENGQIWEVEVPKIGMPTASYLFNSRSEAEKFGDSQCFTLDKSWKVAE